ncbi:MAG: hypothetical protein AAFR35_13440 [Pseudomonadota bacterium]
MTSPLPLEAFDHDPIQREPRHDHDSVATQIDVDETRKAAFEEGYESGWSDANTSAAADAERIREDLARNLRNLSFTYTEARAEILDALEPFLTAILARLIPQLLPEAIAAQVVEELREVAASSADIKVELRVAPEDRDPVARLMPTHAAMPVTIVAEPALASGQAMLSFATEEIEIGIDGFVETIRDAFEDTRNYSKVEQRYG